MLWDLIPTTGKIHEYFDENLDYQRKKLRIIC